MRVEYERDVCSSPCRRAVPCRTKCRPARWHLTTPATQWPRCPQSALAQRTRWTKSCESEQQSQTVIPNPATLDWRQIAESNRPPVHSSKGPRPAKQVVLSPAPRHSASTRVIIACTSHVVAPTAHGIRGLPWLIEGIRDRGDNTYLHPCTNTHEATSTGSFHILRTRPIHRAKSLPSHPCPQLPAPCRLLTPPACIG